jgi:RNA polymerase sigma-70 factor (ECF subfamily)
MPTPCELDLVRAASARCPEAMAALYRAHFGPLQRRALAITGCPQDAADAAQDALLATFERLPDLDVDALHFGAYATTAARNQALKRRRIVAEPLDTPVEDDTHVRMEREELRRRVRDAIRELPERQRRVIFRADFEELPRDEIAREFGLNENAIAQLLFRARRNLESNLKGPDPFMFARHQRQAGRGEGERDRHDRQRR